MANNQIAICTLPIFCIWILSLYSRIFDKTVKKYSLNIGILLVLWMIIRIIRSVIRDTNILWYIYYIPLIFMPTYYYLTSKYLIKKKSYNSILIGVSIVLVLLVITNDLHKVVFTSIDETGDYTHKAGYYIIAIWILYLIIKATINLSILEGKNKNKNKMILPFIPIILGIIYTVLYVLNYQGIRSTNMSVIIGTLFFLGIEIILQMDLIPNNIRYKNPYKNSNLHMGIISGDGEMNIKTKFNIKIPTQIIQDIKEKKVKEKYFNLEGNSKEYELKNIKGGYTIFEKDSQEIEKLKKDIKEKNTELKEQQRILEKDKEIRKELYEIKIRNEILDKLEIKIEEKRNVISAELSNMREFDYKKLAKIKLLLEYCKRISSLIISNYNNEAYNEEKLKLLITELFKNAENLNTKGVIVVDDIKPVHSITALKIYDNIFTIIEDLPNTDILVLISQNNGAIILKITIVNNINGLKEKLISKRNEGILSIEEKHTEDGTKITIIIDNK